MCGLDAGRRDADTAALEHPDRAGSVLDPPALRKETARGEPARARYGGIADEQTAVEPLQAVREALGRLRGRRRVAVGPLSLGGRVVPEIHASVVDAGIEHG